jgi:hypothetical protein
MNLEEAGWENLEQVNLVASCCDNCNEIAGPIKGGELLE